MVTQKVTTVTLYYLLTLCYSTFSYAYIMYLKRPDRPGIKLLLIIVVIPYEIVYACHHQ